MPGADLGLLWNWTLDHTVGTFMEAVSHTVSPWATDNLKREETYNLQVASGGKMSESDAARQANSDVDTVLKQAGAHPDQFWDGLKDSLKSGESSTLLILGGLALVLLGVTILPLLLPRR